MLGSESLSLNRDLRIAKEVQKAFIPQSPPSIPDLSCAMYYQPAHCIGGDYYDFFQLPNGRWGIAIGDVSGKGIGAALMMATLHASMRAQVLQAHSGPATLISSVNLLVHESSPPHFFASLFYAEYNPSTRLLQYINAGHNPPIVIRCNERGSMLFQLNHGGAPLGIFADSPHHPKAFQLAPGDTIVACTDGITEAENIDGEGWGQKRLEDSLSTCRCRTAQQVLEDLMTEISIFTEGTPQKDDMALMVMQVQPL